MGPLVNLLIGITIALLPLFIKVGSVDITRTSRDNLLVIIFGVLCFFLPKKERQLGYFTYVALAYGLFCLVFNQWNAASTVVMFQVFYVAIGFVFFASYYEKHSIEGRDHILNGMAIGCLIQCVIIFFAVIDIPLYYKFISIFYSSIKWNGTVSQGVGSLGNSNLLASYVSLTALAMFRKKWAWFLPLPLIALFVAHSMMGIAAFIAGSLYFLNLKFNLIKKSWIYIGTIAAMVTVYFTGLNGMDTQRFYGWSENFRRVDLNHFLFGKGPGWFGTHGVFLNPGELMTQEHNAFLTAFNMFGIVGIILLVPMFLKLINSKDQSFIFPSVVFAAFVNSYGHFTLHQSTVAIIIIVALAICLAEKDSNVVNVEW